MEITSIEIVEPKPKVNRFDPTLRWSPELVDYESHPAYKTLTQESNWALSAKALTQFAKSMLPLLLKRLIRYEMIPVEIRRPKSALGFIKFLKVASKNAITLGKNRDKSSVNSSVFQTIERDGVCVVRMSDNQFERLNDCATQHFQRLEIRRSETETVDREFEASRSSVDARDHGDDLAHEIENILVETAVLDAASRYLGRDASLIDVNPQINDSSDSFWRKIFPDVEDITLPESAYFHRDASGGDLKAIIYMTDVGEQNGPFTYVVGSHKLSISKLDDLIAEANDHNGLSSTNPEARRRFAALPRKLQQKGSFGNDLVKGSELNQQIQNGAWEITSSKGAIVLFDTKGVHRGGMVAAGERYVITNVIG